METEHYRYMVVITYNMATPLKGAGSCIFFHVSPAPGGGTAGCTALAAEDLLTVLRWMDPAKHPLLLQMPEGAMDAALAAWSLPSALGVER
jgi:D-alanyl-D-alanine dipeptidase